MPKILLVEDDPIELNMYTSLFKKEGYSVTTLTTGTDCRAKAVEIAPDAILLDIMMPHMNGFVTIDVLHFDPKTRNIPIIVLTNLSDEHYEKEALKRGAVLFLTKSNIENIDLVAKVSDIIHAYSTTIST